MKTTILTTLLMLFSVAGFAQVPTEAAPTPPARDAADVISIFSDAYTDITVGTFSADFDDSDIADTTIAGDAAKKITFTNFLGVDFRDNRQDLTGMTHFHIDFWTSNSNLDGTVFNQKLSNWAGGGGEANALEFNINTGTDPAIVSGSWVSVDVELDSFNPVNGSGREDIAQYLITSNLGVVFVDNIYFYDDGTGTGGGGGGGTEQTLLFADSLNAATATDDWIQAGDAAGRPSEVTFEYDAAAGVDGSGAVRMGGTNADGAGGRAYIFEKIFTEVDFGGATNVNVNVSIKSEALAGTNVAVLTDIGGSIQENASVTGELSDAEYTTFTFNHPAISESANSVKFSFNVAAGAAVDLGGTILIDNLTVTTDADNGGGGGNLVTNGDFEAGDDGSWYGNALDIRTEGGNSFNFADVATAGNPFDVNLSQNVDITPGETYTLTFQASTSPEDGSRTMIVGIGESQDPFRANVETVTITDTPETYTLELIATDDGGNGDFGDATSRVIFDMGADVGVVVLDNVTLIQGTPPVEGELVTNGDFEAGDDGSWYGNALDIRTEGGNSFNFADVATAGNPFDVNLSQNVDITPGETYTLTFQASTSPEDGSRTMVVGIGESQDPFRADVETVTITDTPETYTLELTATDDGGNGDFGDATSRVIFDMGADVGVVVLDDVSLRQGLATSNENEDELPSEYVLNQNYPNPFNPTTNISFTIPQAEQVSIKVYDMLGREVATLVNQQRFGAGAHQVTFDAANLASGIYIYRLQAGTASFTKKMTLIK